MNARSSPRRLTPRRVLAGALALLALAAMAGGLARVSVQTGIESFLPGSDASLFTLNNLASKFGGEPIVVLLESAKAKQLTDVTTLPNVLHLEGELSGLPDVAVVYGPGTILNQIAGQAQDLLAELSGRRDALQAQAQAAAKARGESAAQVDAAGQHALDVFDARYGPLIVQGLPAGLPTLSNPSFADSVIYSGTAQPAAQWRFVVPNANSIAILIRPRQHLDAAASTRLVDAVRRLVRQANLPAQRTTVSGVPALVSALSTQTTHEMPWLAAIAVLAVSACFLFVPWTRRRHRLKPVLSTALAVGMTLAVWGWLGRPLSLGVVAFLPVLLGIGSYYPTYLARHRDRRTVLTVALATAASFASLAVSPLPFVRDMGLTLGLGVALSVLVGMALTPRPAQRPDTMTVPDRLRRRSRGWMAGCLVAGLLAIAGWSVLPSLRLQTNFEHYASGLPAVSAATHVAAVLGSSAELDVVLQGPNVLTPAAYNWLSAAEAEVITRHGDQAHPIVSITQLLSFLGGNPTADEIAAGARLVPPYLLGAAVDADRTDAVLSFGVDITDLPRVDAVAQDITAHLPAVPAGYHAEVAGLPIVAARGEQLVSGDRVLLNVLGVVAATTVLALGLRRRSDALRAGAAATLAGGVGLLALWLFGITLTPITIALGTLTAAVCAEFTVMLAQSTRAAQRDVRAAVVLAVSTSTLGYLCLTSSSLAVIRQFGLLLACGVVLAFGCAALVVHATCRAHPVRAASNTEAPEPAKSEPMLIGVK